MPRDISDSEAVAPAREVTGMRESGSGGGGGGGDGGYTANGVEDKAGFYAAYIRASNPPTHCLSISTSIFLNPPRMPARRSALGGWQSYAYECLRASTLPTPLF